MAYKSHVPYCTMAHIVPFPKNLCGVVNCDHHQWQIAYQLPDLPKFFVYIYTVYIWVNYNDLTATSLESWLVREIIPKWP